MDHARIIQRVQLALDEAVGADSSLHACPVCQAPDPVRGGDEHDDARVYVSYSCPSCGSDWTASHWFRAIVNLTVRDQHGRSIDLGDPIIPTQETRHD